MFRLASVLLASLCMAILPVAAVALDAVTLGTNWKAQAEHGGFYQAQATGLYAAHGLEVTIRPGGPQVNQPQLLAAGRIDFSLAGSMSSALNYVTADVPMVTIAAIFQRSPLALMAHPGRGIETPADLAGMPILISAAGRQTFWDWLKSAHGLRDDQLRPYTFNAAPFIADPGVAQQGYVTSEPFVIAREGGFSPRVLLLADFGYDSYASTIETSWRLVEEDPDLVQRFVDASILGWVSYLHGDPTPANELIKADNPDMTDALIAYSIEQMTAHGIVDSGDALTLGIGAMTDARWQRYYDQSAAAGRHPAGLDLARAYTLAFVNREVGLALKRELTGG